MFNFYRVPLSGWLTILFLLTFVKPCVSQDDDALRRQLQRGFEGLELISQFVELEAIDDATFAFHCVKPARDYEDGQFDCDRSISCAFECRHP